MREIKFEKWDKKYEIGSDGTVWSLDYNHTGQRKQLHTYTDNDGYLYVFLNHDGKRTKVMVHRMVAEIFIIGHTSERYQVNHINGIRNDNRMENLEWVSPQENVLHSYRSNGRRASLRQRDAARNNFCGANNPKSKLNNSTVNQLRKLKHNHSAKQLSDKFDISLSQVYAIISYRCWKTENPELLEQEGSD